VEATLMNKGAMTLTGQWSLLGYHPRLARQTVNMLPDSVPLNVCGMVEDSRASLLFLNKKGGVKWKKRIVNGIS